MKKSSIILTSLFLSGFCAVHYMQGSPAGDTLDPVKKEITEKFINASSDEVAKDLKRDDRLPISQKFQEYLENNEKATKVFQVYRDGTGEFSMQVINLEEDINQKFKNTTNTLNDKNKSAIKKELGAKTLTAVGVLMVVGGICCGVAQDAVVGGVVGTMGAGTAIGGWTLWSWSLDEQHNRRVHIEQNIIMNEKWRNTFYQCKKERPKN